jgi:hypothetical protein
VGDGVADDTAAGELGGEGRTDVLVDGVLSVDVGVGRMSDPQATPAMTVKESPASGTEREFTVRRRVTLR